MGEERATLVVLVYRGIPENLMKEIYNFKMSNRFSKMRTLLNDIDVDCLRQSFHRLIVIYIHKQLLFDFV